MAPSPSLEADIAAGEAAAFAPEAAPEPDPLRQRRENDRIILLIALAVIAAAFVLQVTPARDGVTLFGRRLPETCGVKRLGGSCPGCGLTRSFVLGVRGDPIAFELNPVGPLLLLIVVGQIPYRVGRMWQLRRLARLGRVPLTSRRRHQAWRVFQGAVFVLVVVVWLVRVALGTV